MDFVHILFYIEALLHNQCVLHLGQFYGTWKDDRITLNDNRGL